jgi:heptosyltransferase-2
MGIQLSPSILRPGRILVRGVNWLGDAVMTTPALQRLREHFPQAHIALFTHEKLGDLWPRHPSLNEVLTFAPGEALWSVAGRLRAGEYDLSLVLPNSPRSAMEPWLARIPQRVGYARPWRNWFLTQTVPLRREGVPMRKRSAREVARLVRESRQDTQRASVPGQSGAAPDRITTQAHHIHNYLHLVAALGASPEPLAPMLIVTAGEVSGAEAGLLTKVRDQTGAVADRPAVWLGLNPSAAYGPAKRWPAENFAAVAREVSRTIARCIWLVFGGPDDVKLGDEIVGRAGGSVINLAGQTSLRQLMALLKLCRVLLANDSGTMHVAAALGTPVVVPFGSTSPELTGPGLPGDPRHQLLQFQTPCSPCFRRICPIDFRCMTGISVEQVLAAVLAAAGAPQPAPAADS